MRYGRIITIEGQDYFLSHGNRFMIQDGDAGIRSVLAAYETSQDKAKGRNLIYYLGRMSYDLSLVWAEPITPASPQHQPQPHHQT